VFGLSFGEFFLLIIVAIVVVGPRNLPSMMRTAGQWVARIRRMSTELRASSGIDQLVRDEGLDRDLREIRALSQVNVLDTLESLAAPTATAAAIGSAKTATSAAAHPVASPLAHAPPSASEPAEDDEDNPREVLREREYPAVGCDSYDAVPDDAAPYGAVPTEDPMGMGVLPAPAPGEAAGT
jgi:sec-independent protein translocase protein TatB